jgi:hypothetical protein
MTEKTTQDLEPSQMARGKAQIKLVHYSLVTGGETLPASRFFDPLQGEGRVITTFTQVDYLDLVLKIKNYFAANGVIVSKPWLNEIVRVERRLREQRQLRPGGTLAEQVLCWCACWDFEVPEYDPDAFTRWDGPELGWVDARSA